MKTTIFVISALFGATQANRDHYYDDASQYQDSNIKDFIEHTQKSMDVVEAPVVVPAPVSKPVLVQKEEPKKVEVSKKKEEDLPMAPQALSESELTAENLAKKDIETEMSNNMSDFEYLQIKNQKTLAHYVTHINGPDDLKYIQIGDNFSVSSGMPEPENTLEIVQKSWVSK